MLARLIDGKAIASGIHRECGEKVQSMVKRGMLSPGLAVVVVGSDPASHVYVRHKIAACADVGVRSFRFDFPHGVHPRLVIEKISELNSRADVHGILVQLPLPSSFDVENVLNAISPAKDVDGFHPFNAGKLFTTSKIDVESMLLPCTPLGCLLMLRQTMGAKSIAGKTAVVIGRSNIVGKPMAQLLLSENATVTMAHSQTKELPALCRTADILVAAVGRAETVRGDWIKPGAVVIDVGINRVPTDDGKSRLVGDVATNEAMEVASAITPVPGGVGPMTVACLLHNTIVAADMRAN